MIIKIKIFILEFSKTLHSMIEDFSEVLYQCKYFIDTYWKITVMLYRVLNRTMTNHDNNNDNGGDILSVTFHY